MKTTKKLILCFSIAIICGFALIQFNGITARANENTSSTTMTCYADGAWKGFQSQITAGTISCLRIQTPDGCGYYLQYQTQNNGRDDFYSAVNSNDKGSEAYAGLSSRPIQKVRIRVYDNSNAKLATNVVVMYRALVNGTWLPWVSNANPDWMQAVQTNYNLGGTLDTSSSYAGIGGQNISGLEIRIFNENSTEINYTPTGNYKIITAPFISQLPSYPTGCESVSTVMALNYNGINTTVDDFIDNYLYKTGTIFDPNISFGGNPRSSGYGCYAPVIKDAVDKVISNKNYYCKIVKNSTMQQLCSEYIDNNIPVILWATINMNTPQQGNAWIYEGRSITWIKPEHCLLLVGYDDNKYIFNDPMKSSAVTYYDKQPTEAAYSGMYSQAVVILSGTDPTIPIFPTSDVRAGKVGGDVLWIQKNLNKLGYKLTENGVFNSETDEVVKNLQKVSGLDVDGIVGINTTRILQLDAIKGDSNLDGVVDIRDLMRVKRYIASGGDVALNIYNSDFYNTGIINSMDLVKLKKALIGID